LGGSQDLPTGRLEAPLLGGEIPNLQPHGEMAHLGGIRDAGYFQVTPAEEQDEPRIIAVPNSR
jgi:hypothetical protein